MSYGLIRVAYNFLLMQLKTLKTNISYVYEVFLVNTMIPLGQADHFLLHSLYVSSFLFLI